MKPSAKDKLLAIAEEKNYRLRQKVKKLEKKVADLRDYIRKDLKR